MQNINTVNGNASGASRAKLGKKPRAVKLPRMEMYAVLGLELSKRIFEKLEEVEKTIDILARQKRRELN